MLVPIPPAGPRETPRASQQKPLRTRERKGRRVPTNSEVNESLEDMEAGTAVLISGILGFRPRPRLSRDWRRGPDLGLAIADETRRAAGLDDA